MLDSSVPEGVSVLLFEVSQALASGCLTFFLLPSFFLTSEVSVPESSSEEDSVVLFFMGFLVMDSKSDQKHLD